MCCCPLGCVLVCRFVLSCFEGPGWLMSTICVPWDVPRGNAALSKHGDPVSRPFCPLNQNLVCVRARGGGGYLRKGKGGYTAGSTSGAFGTATATMAAPKHRIPVSCRFAGVGTSLCQGEQTALRSPNPPGPPPIAVHAPSPPQNPPQSQHVRRRSDGAVLPPPHSTTPTI